MYMTNLRKVGGSVMMAVPPALLEVLGLQVGAVVGMDVNEGQLIIRPQGRPRYSLDELLAQCDAAPVVNDEDHQWLEAPVVGDEI